MSPAVVGGLDGQVAVVTGAAGAIGGDIVSRLAAAGATVVAADLDPPVPVAGDVVPITVVPMAMDVCDPDAVVSAIDGVAEQLGRIDILVNAAGVFGDMARTDRIDPAVWDRYLQVNLSGPFFVSRAVLPHMVTRRYGRIVNFSSISSTAGGYRQAHYAAAKAGVEGLTRSIALEYAPVNITANAVLPGPIDTPKTGQAPADVRQGAVASIPAARFGTTGDVAAVVAFLVTPEAGYVNGTSIPVDGGALLLQFRFARQTRFP